MKKLFKNLFKEKGKKIKPYEERFFKNRIRNFFGYEDIMRLEITDIKFLKFKNKLQITITLLRPGLLIGEHGNTINGLIEYLSFLKKFPNIEISVKESRIWD